MVLMYALSLGIICGLWGPSTAMNMPKPDVNVSHFVAATNFAILAV